MGCSFNEEKVGHKHTQININNHEHRQMWAWKKKKTEIIIRSHRPQRESVAFRVEIRLLVKTVIQQHEEKKTKQIHIKVCVWEKVSHTHTHRQSDLLLKLCFPGARSIPAGRSPAGTAPCRKHKQHTNKPRQFCVCGRECDILDVESTTLTDH